MTRSQQTLITLLSTLSFIALATAFLYEQQKTILSNTKHADKVRFYCSNGTGSGITYLKSTDQYAGN